MSNIGTVIAALLFTINVIPSMPKEKHAGTREMSIFDLCRQKIIDLSADDALSLSAALDDDNQTNTKSSYLKYGFDTENCRVTIKLKKKSHEASGWFLIVFANNLPIDRGQCQTWNVLMKLKSSKHSESIGCSKYLVQYFDSPLTITFLPVALAQLIRIGRSQEESPDHQLISLIITPVLFECFEKQDNWSRCSENVCIKRHFFCDNINNCGLWEDEQRCNGSRPSCLFDGKMEENIEDYEMEYDQKGEHFDAILTFVLSFCAFLTLAIVVTITVYCIYIRRKLNREKQKNLATYMNKIRPSLLGRRREKGYKGSDDSLAPNTVAVLCGNGIIRNYASISVPEHNELLRTSMSSKKSSMLDVVGR